MDEENELIATRRQKLANGKHVQQWQNTMRAYVFPHIGQLAVAQVTAADVLAVGDAAQDFEPVASVEVSRRRLVFAAAAAYKQREHEAQQHSHAIRTQHRPAA